MTEHNAVTAAMGSARSPALFPELDQDIQLLSKTGVFPSQHLRRAIKDGSIQCNIPIQEAQIQPASLDLRLGPIAYQVRASCLPGDNTSVQTMLKVFTIQEPDLS